MAKKNVTENGSVDFVIVEFSTGDDSGEYRIEVGGKEITRCKRYIRIGGYHVGSFSIDKKHLLSLIKGEENEK